MFSIIEEDGVLLQNWLAFDFILFF